MEFKQEYIIVIVLILLVYWVYSTWNWKNEGYSPNLEWSPYTSHEHNNSYDMRHKIAYDRADLNYEADNSKCLKIGKQHILPKQLSPEILAQIPSPHDGMPNINQDNNSHLSQIGAPLQEVKDQDFNLMKAWKQMRNMQGLAGVEDVEGILGLQEKLGLQGLQDTNELRELKGLYGIHGHPSMQEMQITKGVNDIKGIEEPKPMDQMKIMPGYNINIPAMTNMNPQVEGMDGDISINSDNESILQELPGESSMKQMIDQTVMQELVRNNMMPENIPNQQMQPMQPMQPPQPLQPVIFVEKQNNWFVMLLLFFVVMIGFVYLRK